MMKLMKKVAGFTLIEVLVSMVVLAFGILGVASLQAIALKSSSSSLFYSQANNFAYNIIDAMRANRAVAIAGGYDYNATMLPYCNNNLDVSAGTIAMQDLARWTNDLACTLPSGTGGIQVATDANNNITATITVQWDNSREQSDQSAIQIQVITNL